MKTAYPLFLCLLSFIILGCNKEPVRHDIPSDMFCITALEDGLEVSMVFLEENNPHMNPSLMYSLDGEKWTDFVAGQSVITISKAGSRLYMKANEVNTSFTCCSASESEYTINCTTFKFSKKAKVSGNIMYLLDGEHPDEAKMGDMAFSCLFMNESLLMDAAELILPARNLSENCFMEMFEGTSISEAPELPATELSIACYYAMFTDCSKLILAPKLPAIKLEEHCYNCMFNGCTSLVTAPELPAAQLTYCCYHFMFNDCVSLTEAPELPAAELTPYCYYAMFKNCSSLKSLTCLATDLNAQDCVSKWLNDVSTTGTLHAAPGTDWAGKIPDSWTVEY